MWSINCPDSPATITRVSYSASSFQQLHNPTDKTPHNKVDRCFFFFCVYSFPPTRAAELLVASACGIPKPKLTYFESTTVSDFILLDMALENLLGIHSHLSSFKFWLTIFGYPTLTNWQSPSCIHHIPLEDACFLDHPNSSTRVMLEIVPVTLQIDGFEEHLTHRTIHYNP